MQTAAVLWHVSLLVPDDRRALALGFVGLARIGPILLFSLVSGVAADALNRRTLMLVTQSMMAVLAAVLAMLTLPRPDGRLADLRAGGVRFRGRRIRSARPAVAASVTRPARRSAERDQPQHDRRAVGVGGRTGAGWTADRDHQHRLGLRGQRALLSLRHRRAGADEGAGDVAHRPRRRGRHAVARGVQPLGGGRRAAVRLPRPAHPIDDAAGFLRDVLFLRHRPAADLRAGRPPRRRTRLRLALRGPGGRRAGRQRRDGARGGHDRAARAGAHRRGRWSTALRRSRSDCRRSSG